jgi:hypothetical protein
MKGFLRVWQELDIKDIEQYLIVIGELSAECFACKKIGIDSKSVTCPNCGVGFKYIGFRRKVEPHYLRQVKERLPFIVFIDFDDLKKIIGKSDARKLLDL